MIFRTALALILGASLMFAAGCSDDNPTSSNNGGNGNTTIWNEDGYWETTDLDASSHTDFNFYSFADRDTVTISLDEAINSTGWDIAFGRVNILINSGDTGPGNVYAVDLASLNRPDSTDFMGFDDPGSIDDSDFSGGIYNLVIDDWYSYNPGNHTFNMTHYVYIMMDAEENYVKFQVISMENNGMPPDMGMVSIQYIYSGSSPVFSGNPDTLTFDASGGGPIYVDFSAGSITNPDNPMNSLDWDILFESYEVHQNNTIFGTGGAGTYEVWVDQQDPTDFNEITMVPSGVPYFADQFGSPMSEWYDYYHTPDNRVVIDSYQHVYVIKKGQSYYKLQILSYYNSDSGDLGWYTFRWLQM